MRTSRLIFSVACDDSNKRLKRLGIQGLVPLSPLPPHGTDMLGGIYQVDVRSFLPSESIVLEGWIFCFPL